MSHSDRPAGQAAKEFSRPFDLSRLGAHALVEEVNADAGERRELAARFGLLSLDSLSARLRLKLLSGGKLLGIEGQLHARLEQSCVVTLEPVEATHDVDFTLAFDLSGGGRRREAETEVDIDPLAEDEPEPLPEGGLDLGEVVAEQLALAIDPYPRAPDAILINNEAGPAEPDEETAKPSPFVALRSLKPKG